MVATEFKFEKLLTQEEIKKTPKPQLQAYLKHLKEQQKKALKAKNEELDKDWQSFTGDITEKFFSEFSGMSAFLDRCVEQINSRYWVISPFGRRRTIYRVLTGKKKFIADAGRRAKNSPIQGISSELGVTSGIMVMRETHKYMLEMDIDMKFFSKYCRAVHDANYYEESYCMVIPAIHIKQYIATYGVTKYYKDVFKFDMGIEPEIEIEIGANEKDSKKWSWAIPDLVKDLTTVVDELIANGNLEKIKREKCLNAIFQPWIEKSTRTYLQRHYPLLNVSELDVQICSALKDAGYKPEE